jgi:hypothetical protein
MDSIDHLLILSKFSSGRLGASLFYSNRGRRLAVEAQQIPSPCYHIYRVGPSAGVVFVITPHCLCVNSVELPGCLRNWPIENMAARVSAVNRWMLYRENLPSCDIGMVQNSRLFVMGRSVGRTLQMLTGMSPTSICSALLIERRPSHRGLDYGNLVFFVTSADRLCGLVVRVSGWREKKRRLCSLFKIFITDICWINI